MSYYDVIVVGGGPGGYVAAIRSAKEGKKTALVEADHLGGTCLNRGCIPSKTLLKHAEIIEKIETAKHWGIKTETLTFDLKAMLARKDEVVHTLRKGIAGLLRAGKVDLYKGFGKILPDKQVMVEEKNRKLDKNSSEIHELKADKIIIATGSRPIVPAIDGLDRVSYHTTDTIFTIDRIPESLAIVGGGAIGVEFANIFSSLRTNVTLIELGDRLIPTEDEAASKALLKSLKKKGVKVITNHQVTRVKPAAEKTEIKVTSKNGRDSIYHVEELLMAVGRAPNLDALKSLDLAMNGHFIKVNEYLETTEKGIFAVGDIIGNYQLAHVASNEGLTAVANLDGQNIKMNYSIMPRCIYTSPQIASVGMTETELKKKRIPYQVHSFNFAGNGMALASGETDGFSKIMVDQKYGEILGVVMVGAHVTEMISQSSAFMYLEGTVEELAHVVQPHPSLSEALMESANALLGKGIHVL